MTQKNLRDTVHVQKCKWSLSMKHLLILCHCSIHHGLSKLWLLELNTV